MLARLVNGGGDRSDDRLARLLDRAGRAHSSDALAPWSLQDLERPGPESFGVEFDDGDGHLVGYVRCVSSATDAGDRTWAFELIPHPFWAGRVEYEMYTVLHAHLLLLGGGEVTWWSGEERVSALARAMGFQPDVEMCELRCPGTGLTPPGPTFTTGCANGKLPAADVAPAGGARLVTVGETSRPLGSCWAIPYDGGRQVEIRSIRCRPGAGGRVVASLVSGALATTPTTPDRTAVASVDASDDAVVAHLLDAGFTPSRRRLAHRSTLPALQ